MEVLQKFIDLTEKKRALQADIRAIEEQLEPLEAAINQDFDANGRSSVSQNGYTVYRSRDVSVKSKTGDTGDVVDTLRKARLGDLIGIKWPTLKAYVKEKMYDEATDTWEVNPERLPPSLRAIVEVSEFYSVRCKKS